MELLEKKLKAYLKEVTGMEPVLQPCGLSHLPFFINRLYGLADMGFGAMSYMVVFLKNEDEFKPAEFLKHLSRISSSELYDVCVVADSLPSYVRKRMIEKSISFVIPNVQMYLPGMGMELRSRAVNKKVIKPDYLSPATQVVLIQWLLGRTTGPVSPLELSRLLNYSTMSMSRALDEIDATGLGQVERVGKERLLTFSLDKQALWSKVLPRLKTPVRYQKRVKEKNLPIKDALPAGLTALSQQTMIAEPRLPEFAISAETWKSLEKKGVEVIPLEEDGTCILQVWRYDPKVLEVEGRADPFSLYLSLMDTTDERIEIALEAMMGRYI